MLNKKIIFIFSLILNLTFCLNSISFCNRKQQECKGLYDRYQIYQTKCELSKCHGEYKYKYECGSKICTKNITACDDYVQMMLYFNLIVDKHSKQTDRIKLFNRHIKDCKIETYKFKPDDFCKNGQKCNTDIYIRLNKMIKPVNCQCPANLSFRCGKYCSINSIACDFYKSKENKKQLIKIKDCGNNNNRYIKSYLNLW